MGSRVYFFGPGPVRRSIERSRASVETLATLKQNGAQAKKSSTASTSAQTPKGGQRMTFQSVYITAMHRRGVILGPPRYANSIKLDDADYPSG